MDYTEIFYICAEKFATVFWYGILALVTYVLVKYLDYFAKRMILKKKIDKELNTWNENNGEIREDKKK